MPASPALTRRSLLLAKIETTFNVDAGPAPQSDAFLVMDANVTVEPNVLERNFYRPSLSNLPIAIGRKLATLSFRHEVKGSGDPARVSKLGTLLRACGFAQTLLANTAAALISNPRPNGLNTGPAVTWGKVAAPTQNHGRYTLRIVAGGASAAAKVRVSGGSHQQSDNTCLNSEEFVGVYMARGRANPPTITASDANPTAPTFTVVANGGIVGGDVVLANCGGYRVKYVAVDGDTVASIATGLAAAFNAIPGVGALYNAAAAAGVVTVTITGGTYTVTTGTTNIALGASGAQVTMSWAGNQVLNDSWVVDAFHPGYHYTPVSTGFESMTMWMLYDGQLHRLTGCIGTVSFTNEAGQYGMAQFTFTGQYTDPEDMPLPTTSIFEATRPQQVELAQLSFGGLRAMRAQSFSLDMGITINPRDSVSHPDGYDGTLYTSRAPTGGLNPEMSYESEEPYWRNMARANLLKFHGRVGTLPGNIVRFMANAVQLRNIGYTDRNNNRVYDMSIGFAQDSDAGDDEVRIVIA